MNKEELEKLYKESLVFKVYVDKQCVTYNATKEQAFEMYIVKEYAKYLLDVKAGKI